MSIYSKTTVLATRPHRHPQKLSIFGSVTNFFVLIKIKTESLRILFLQLIAKLATTEICFKILSSLFPVKNVYGKIRILVNDCKIHNKTSYHGGVSKN